jgi:hypothetical protein
MPPPPDMFAVDGHPRPFSARWKDKGRVSHRADPFAVVSPEKKGKEACSSPPCNQKRIRQNPREKKKKGGRFEGAKNTLSRTTAELGGEPRR